jgi:hypothetical protein
MALSRTDRQLISTLAAQHGVSENAVETLWHAVQAGNGTAAQFNHPELGGMGQWMAGGMVMVGDFSRPQLQATVMGICTAIAAHLQGAQTPSPTQSVGAGSRQTQSQRQTPSAQMGNTAVNQPRSADPQSAKANKGGGLLSSIGKLFGGSSGDATAGAQGPSTVHRSGAWWPDEFGSPNSSGSQNEMYYAYFAAPRRLALRIGNRVTIYDTGEHQISGVSQQQGGPQTVTFRSQKGEVAVSRLKKLRDYRL